MKRAFKVGDLVRVSYLCDRHPCNGLTGVVSWVNNYRYYPNRDETVVEIRQQGEITYANGLTVEISNMHRERSGLVAEVELVKPAKEEQHGTDR